MVCTSKIGLASQGLLRKGALWAQIADALLW
jgi:hypothetical protein